MNTEQATVTDTIYYDEDTFDGFPVNAPSELFVYADTTYRNNIVDTFHIIVQKENPTKFHHDKTLVGEIYWNNLYDCLDFCGSYQYMPIMLVTDFLGSQTYMFIGYKQFRFFVENKNGKRTLYSEIYYSNKKKKYIHKIYRKVSKSFKYMLESCTNFINIHIPKCTEQ